MKRREAVKKLAIGVPAGLAFPGLLAACEKTQVTPTPVYDGNVIVIGAGAAGLYTAQQFLRQNIEVKVLEATDRYGGRVRLQKEFFDFPMEMGADRIIGDTNLWYDMVKNSGINVVEFPETQRLELDNLIKDPADLSNDVDYLSAMAFVSDIINYNGPDLTIENAVFSANLPGRVHHLVEGMTATGRGTSFNNISIKGVSDGLQAWQDGSGRYLAENQALVNIMGGAFSDVVPYVQLNTPVTQVNYTDLNKIVLTDANGETHECTILIVTVPIPIIKNGDIIFTPELPITNTAALDRIGMDAGYKVMLGFYVNFWGKDIGTIYTNGTAREYYAPGIGRDKENRILAALIMGDKAEALAGKTEDEIVQLLLSELDALYDGEASQQFDESSTYVMDWGANPYFKGVKSYPMVSGTGAARQYATPVDNRIFFAGEATALNGNYGTVQGALESAERVVKEVLEVIL